MALDYQDEDPTAAITAQIKSAVHDSNPRLSLAQIHCTVSNSGSTYLLDPLNTLPILLLSRDHSAGDLISLIGECSSAKEVIIAVQEAVERLVSNLTSEIDEDTDQDKWQTPSAQLASLVSLYASSIPRLKAGKKTPYEFLQPLCSQLESAIQLAAAQSRRNDGREIMCRMFYLVRGVSMWVKGLAGYGDNDIRACQDILKQLLDSTITANASSIGSSLAQRSFERCFPRLTIRSAVETGWEEGERVLGEAKDALCVLGVTPYDIPAKPTISSLVLLAHSPNLLPTSQLLSSMLPILLTSIQTNTALDESLSLLLTTLYSAQSPGKDYLSSDIVIPLFTVLPSLGSAHPDPATRHLTYRILSLLLSLTPSALRLRLLKDMTSDSDFPQMCVAAIGLVKEAILEALSDSPAPNQNVFASSLFIQVLGPVLFRPRPADLFSEPLTAKDFQRSLEPPRLVECLSLYYVLLLRDKNNRTGVRDPDTILDVEKSLLCPLRLSLERWMSADDIAHSHVESIIPLASLQMSLERADQAVSRFSLALN